MHLNHNILKIGAGLFLMFLGLFVRANECNIQLSTSVNALTQEQILDHLSDFESEIQSLIQSNYNQNLTLILEIQDELAVEIEVALEENSPLGLLKIKENLEVLKGRIEAWKDNLSSVNNEEKVIELIDHILKLEDFLGFHQLVEDVGYQVVSNTVDERVISVSFAEKLLRELTSPKVSARVQKDLFSAVKNGFVYADGMKGLKVMTTFEGIRFVEAKVIGGEAGNYRIYGCLDGAKVEFHFLGQDTNGGSDPQRRKIKKICHK